MNFNTEKQKSYQPTLINILLVIVSVAVLIYAFTLLKSYKNIDANQQNTIVVSGTGKVEATPDTAKISFSIRESGKTSKEAQEAVAKKWDAAKVKLLALGVEEKDIKNTSFTTYPKYDWVQDKCVAGSSYCGGKQVINGYEVTQSIDIKSKKIDDTGKLLEALAAASINEVSGPSLIIDDEDGLKSEARGLAITNAKEKAKLLAKQLGVDLGDVLYFRDVSSAVTMPYAEGGMMIKTMSARADMAPIIPDVPAGVNEIVSNVSITYEIK
jgi:uncharacterized protein YggE